MTKQNASLLNLTQAAEAVGITRKTLYTHIEKGLVSVTRQQGKRYIDVSELMRHYGSVSLPEEKVNTVTRSQPKQENDALLSIKKELVALREIVERQQLLLEDQTTSQKLQESLSEVQIELDKVKAELEAERSKGFWKKLFKG